MKHHRRHARLPIRGRPAAPVLYGFDAEFGNSILGLEYPRCTSGDAARALLAEISGYAGGICRESTPPTWRWSEHELVREESTATEYGRKYLTNGDCVYVDLEHLEICLAERLDCFEFPLAMHTAIHRAERARQAANAKLPAGLEIVVFANNSDGLGNSYGSHMNFLLPRSLWDDIFHLKSLYLPYLASIQAAMIVLAGQGKVGSENGRPHVDYQIAQRPDFFVSLSSLETTIRRGLVNARRESLCGPEIPGLSSSPAEHDRLHVIFFDWTLMPVAATLKCGLMQLVLAGMQRGLVKPGLVLEAPVESASRFSRDPTLSVKASTITGQDFTAVELLCMLAETLSAPVHAGEMDEMVPHSRELYALLEETLVRLKDRDYPSLAGRLDWVLKRMLLQQEIDQNPELSWTSPEIKHLDQIYSSTAPDGLFNACARAGLIERMPSETDIWRCLVHPPEQTRAWTRGHLLRAAGRYAVHINWDSIAFQAWESPTTCRCWRVDLPDPTAFTRAQTEPIFRRAEGLDDLFRRLNELRVPGSVPPLYPGDEPTAHRHEFRDVPDRSGLDEPVQTAQADPCSITLKVRGDHHA